MMVNLMKAYEKCKKYVCIIMLINKISIKIVEFKTMK